MKNITIGKCTQYFEKTLGFQTNLFTESVKVRHVVQFCAPLFCPQQKVIHIGFESADHCPENICLGAAGVAGPHNPLCLHQQG